MDLKNIKILQMDFEIFKIILVSKERFNLFLIINLKFALKFILTFILIFLFAFSSHFGREKQRRQKCRKCFFPAGNAVPMQRKYLNGIHWKGERERCVCTPCPNSSILNVQLCEDGKSVPKTLVLYNGYANTYPMWWMYLSGCWLNHNLVHHN